MADLPQLASATWADLTEVQPFETMTSVERDPVNFGGERMEHWKHSWINLGIVPLKFGTDPTFMALIDAYVEQREKLPKNRSWRTNYWDGWHYRCAYLSEPSLLDLALDPFLADAVRFLLDDAPLLHLALTGWAPTERGWHQDSYLNPPNVWSAYVAAWIALDDITEDSGPFQFVPGSHRWEVLRQEKLFERLPPEITGSADWPSITQKDVSRICEDKIKEVGAMSVKYLPRKGDVLLWHSNLLHRETAPKNPDALSKSLILNYSAMERRPDMSPKVQFGGGFYFDGPTDG